MRCASAERAPTVAGAGRLGASCARDSGRPGDVARNTTRPASPQRSQSEPSAHSRGVHMSSRSARGSPPSACAAMAGAVLIPLAPAALAQDWPNRSIVAVSTVTAGNAADTIARVVLDQVGRQIGQSFVIENRTGPGGTIGSPSPPKADPHRPPLPLLTAPQRSPPAPPN